MVAAFWLIFRIASCIAIVASTAACQTAEPIHIIGGCLLPGVESVRATSKESETRCDFSRVVTLVAVPPAKPTLTAFVKAGVAEGAASLLTDISTEGNKWCTVEKVAPEIAESKPGWTVQCTQTDIQIIGLSAVASRSMIVKLGPGSRGAVRLLDVRAID